MIDKEALQAFVLIVCMLPVILIVGYVLSMFVILGGRRQ